MMRTAQLFPLLLLVGFLGSNAWAGDADRFRELISGEPLTEEELAQYYGRGVNQLARVRFAETFAETFLEGTSGNHSFIFNERFAATAASSLGTTGATSRVPGRGAGAKARALNIKKPAGVRMPTVTPASQIRARIAELRTAFRSKF